MREHKKINRSRQRRQPAAELYGPADRLATVLTFGGQGRLAQLREILRWRTEDPTAVPLAVTRLIEGASPPDQPRLEGLYLGLIGRYERTVTPSLAPAGLDQTAVDRWASRLDGPLADRLAVILAHRPGLGRVGSLIWELLVSLEPEGRAVAQFVVATSPLAPYHRLPQPRQHRTDAFAREHRDLLAHVWAAVNHFGPDRVGLARHLLGGLLVDERLTQAERALLLAAAFDFHGCPSPPAGLLADGVDTHQFQKVSEVFHPAAF